MWRRVDSTLESMAVNGQVQVPGQWLSQLKRLIEASLAQPPAVQGNRKQKLYSRSVNLRGQGICPKITQHTSIGQLALIFKAMDKLINGKLIGKQGANQMVVRGVSLADPAHQVQLLGKIQRIGTASAA